MGILDLANASVVLLFMRGEIFVVAIFHSLFKPYAKSWESHTWVEELSLDFLQLLKAVSD